MISSQLFHHTCYVNVFSTHLNLYTFQTITTWKHYIVLSHDTSPPFVYLIFSMNIFHESPITQIAFRLSDQITIRLLRSFACPSTTSAYTIRRYLKFLYLSIWTSFSLKFKMFIAPTKSLCCLYPHRHS